MRKVKIRGVFVIFLLSIVSHFIYGWIPNNIFSIIFPVNESVWEHMKLVITPVLIFSIFEYILYKKKDIYFNNFILSYGISIVIGIFSYLILYLPIHYIIGHSTIYAIVLLFIIFIIIQIISYYIMNYREIWYSNVIGIIIIMSMYIIFGYLTYNPIEIDIFYDTQKKIYGIPEGNTNQL